MLLNNYNVATFPLRKYSLPLQKKYIYAYKDKIWTLEISYACVWVINAWRRKSSYRDRLGINRSLANRARFTLPWRATKRLGRPIASVHRDNAANKQRFTTSDTCVERGRYTRGIKSARMQPRVSLAKSSIHKRRLFSPGSRVDDPS